MGTTFVHHSRGIRVAVALVVIALVVVTMWGLSNLNLVHVHADNSLASVADRIVQLVNQGIDVEVSFHTPIGSDKVGSLIISQKSSANTFELVGFGADYVCVVVNEDPKTAKFCIPDSNIAFFDYHGTPAGVATATATK